MRLEEAEDIIMDIPKTKIYCREFGSYTCTVRMNNKDCELCKRINDYRKKYNLVVEDI